MLFNRQENLLPSVAFSPDDATVNDPFSTRRGVGQGVIDRGAAGEAGHYEQEHISPLRGRRRWGGLRSRGLAPPALLHRPSGAGWGRILGQSLSVLTGGGPAE